MMEQTAISRRLSNPAEVVDYWKNFYSVFFGLKADFSGLSLFPLKENNHHYLLLPKSLYLGRILEVADNQTPIFINFPNVIALEHDREPDRDYAIIIEDCQEPSTDLVGRKASEIISQGIPCMSLPERLIYGLDYQHRHERLLDLENVTFCIGSRSKNGKIPGIDYKASRGYVEIDHYGDDDVAGSLRPREIIEVPV